VPAGLQDNREMSENLIRSRRCKSDIFFRRLSGQNHWETGKVEEKLVELNLWIMF